MDRRVVVRRGDVVRRQEEHSALECLLLEQILQERTVSSAFLAELQQRPLGTADRFDPRIQAGFLGHRIDTILQGSAIRLYSSQGIGAFQNIEDFHRSGHRRYLTGEGETKKYFREDGHYVRAAQHAGDRKPVPHGLAKTCQIWRHTKKLLRAAHSKMKACTDLVKNQQRSALVGKIFYTGKKTRGGFDKVHRLHDHRSELARMLVERSFQTGEVVVNEGMRQLPHGFWHTGISRCATDIPVLPAVVSTTRDSVPAGEGTGRAHSARRGVGP